MDKLIGRIGCLLMLLVWGFQMPAVAQTRDVQWSMDCATPATNQGGKMYFTSEQLNYTGQSGRLRFTLTESGATYQNGSKRMSLASFRLFDSNGTEVVLKANQVSGNNNKSIANMLDGNTGTFCNGAWDTSGATDDYFEIALMEDLGGSFSFSFITENATMNAKAFRIEMTPPVLYTFAVDVPQGHTANVTYDGRSVTAGEIFFEGAFAVGKFLADDIEGYTWNVVVDSNAKTITLVYEALDAYAFAVEVPEGHTTNVTYNGSSVPVGTVFYDSKFDTSLFNADEIAGYTWRVVVDNNAKTITLVYDALPLELLGLYVNGLTTPQMKARLNAKGRTIKSVTTYAYRMTDGYFTTMSNYELINGSIITADVSVQSGNYAYQLEVVLDDDTRLITECVNAANTEAFMWLGDFQWTSATTSVAGALPAVDHCFNSNDSIKLGSGNGTVYYKGISSRGGQIVYDLPKEKNFQRFVMKTGTQTGTTQSIKYLFTCNGGTELGFSHNAGVVKDISTATYPQFIPSLPLVNIKLNFTNNKNVVANYALARLYMDRLSKLDQQIVFEEDVKGVILSPGRMELKASATSGNPVSFRLVGGQDMAELNGNMLTIKDGHVGDVVVEAAQYGDSRYKCAVDYVIFKVNTGGEQIFVSSMLPASGDASSGKVYVYVDPKGKQFSQLTLGILDNDVRKLVEVSQVDLLAVWNNTPSVPEATSKFLEVEVPGLQPNRLFRVSYTYEGEEKEHLFYSQGEEEFCYVSDLEYTAKVGWGSLGVDRPVEGNVLKITDTEYSKGFGIHSPGWLNVALPAGVYSRFATDIGKQSGFIKTMQFSLVMDGKVIAQTGNVDQTVKTSWDYPVTGVSVMQINVANGPDGNGADHGSIGAPRLYRPAKVRREQTLTWRDEVVLWQPKPTKLQLDAVASSGLAPVYRILKGSEYATIEDGNVLNVHTIPEKGNIVVEAFQPGDRGWLPAETVTCTYAFTKGVVVQKDERVELEGGQTLNELIVYGDAGQIGQVVANGVVQVKKLILKYTFVPKAWNFISFPSDLNIDKISNLNEKGYFLNNKTTGRGAYYIRSYDTKMRAENPGGSVWKTEDTPEVKGMKGYIMGINNALGMDPVEITFTIDNASLDFDNPLRSLNLSLDLYEMEPETSQEVYIRPTNVKGNTLKVNVKFRPEDLSVLPINHERALENMRFTYIPNRQGIRLTLPDQTPARVAIYNKKGTKLLKAVRYVSPMVLDMSDIESGTYLVVINYGKATAVKTLDFVKQQ